MPIREGPKLGGHRLLVAVLYELSNIALEYLADLSIPYSVLDMTMTDILHPLGERRNHDLQSSVLADSNEIAVAEAVAAQEDLAVNTHQGFPGFARVNYVLEFYRCLL